MANDFNNFSFIGRLTRDGEMKYTASGMAVVNFSVACNKKLKEKDYVNYFDVSLWGKLGEALQKYLIKGQQVLVSGEIKQDRWTTQDGQNRSKIIFIANNIQFIGNKNENQNQPEFNDPYQQKK